MNFHKGLQCHIPNRDELLSILKKPLSYPFPIIKSYYDTLHAMPQEVKDLIIERSETCDSRGFSGAILFKGF
jgi:hypothetical protein